MIDAARPRVCGEIAKVEKSDQVGEVVVNLYVEDSKVDPTIKPPPTKKSRLHYEKIIMGEMLSDIMCGDYGFRFLSFSFQFLV